MTLATLVNRLIAEGSIERVRVNTYRVGDTYRTRALRIPAGTILHPLAQVHLEFTEPYGDGYTFRNEPRAERQPVVRATVAPTADEPRPMRRIERGSYHSNGSGTQRRGCESALQRIANDEDGVRRSYGLEWEIYSLSRERESELAYLLDTLPAHYTERDGSLGESGVEIIFLPLGLEDIKRVWNTLKTFCAQDGVQMSGTGAHLTYGVSNSTTTMADLQIRINRIALAVKSVGTQRQIISLFGRDFTGYARLPESTTTQVHSNAWSASRGNSAYELRLCCWKGDIDRITAFMKATEFVFNRTFTAQDFISIFNIMGANPSEA